MKKHLLFWVTIFVVVAVMVILALYGRGVAPPVPSPSQGTNTLQQSLEQSANEASKVPNINLPSANPINAAVPKVNPLQNTNPFNNVKTNGYQNPF